MPARTGIELAIAIVEKISHCQVLLFSGQASTMDLLANARASGYDFATLTKPIHPKELLARIAGCIKVHVPNGVSTQTRVDDAGTVSPAFIPIPFGLQ